MESTDCRKWLASYENTTGDKSMKLNEIYTSNSSFLKCEDLQGKTVRLKISEVGTHTFDEGKDSEKSQIVLSFEGKEKKLGLNVTNANSIAKILGGETDNWIGGEIKIYPTTTDFGDKRDVPCIRIVEELPPEAEEDIPGW